MSGLRSTYILQIVYQWCVCFALHQPNIYWKLLTQGEYVWPQINISITKSLPGMRMFCLTSAEYCKLLTQDEYVWPQINNFDNKLSTRGMYVLPYISRILYTVNPGPGLRSTHLLQIVYRGSVCFALYQLNIENC